MRGTERIIKGPHLVSGETGQRILWTHIGALWLVVVVGAAFFGWWALAAVGCAVLASGVIDLAMCRLVGSRNPASLPHAVLIGLLLGLALPAMADSGMMLQIAVVGAVIACLVGKWVFGGMGYYVWHPAVLGILAVHLLFQAQVGMVGRDEELGIMRRNKYLLLSNDHLFFGDISQTQVPEFYGFGQERSELLRLSNYQGWSQSVPGDSAEGWRLYGPVQVLQELAIGGIKNDDGRAGVGFSAVERAIFLALPPLSDALVGCTGGGIGETSVVAILLGGMYLIYRGYVRWQLPVSFLAAAAVGAAVLPMPVGPEGELVWFPAFVNLSRGAGDFWYTASVGITYISFHLCSGGLMLVAFFLASDMSTRPVRLKGQVIFGIGAGMLTIVARLYGGWPMAPLGAYVALLIMNTLSPAIDLVTRAKPYGR